ncbi:hypothetical protein A3D05_05260 [Candidatus Gottesmanbacteria bacterium RIFCSPHIGHO2_02_FULL_40_24]|uniref:Uncharacterized protein n=1 Tax=Candidatus Gottesmanbacteria bacterium RIFCSPHIGHO2_01_FULL_40_15 TaxID=1798376 RepID=A0A1F5Z6P3_9BACT|nr:MAG: hypothetical protein A2777_01895 [Candidatus Gottesmanbacteria bacterium RIFCSPHIGHO2_01_FULL_40_15]OGG16440.1 MAG: hypothetical protein A3D05_05260 [Candidatus Gottesmanbacteria bacterium RIFCSPHIGHO2_02_FULL_40_24]OGG22721.1 MAG: hypothetical protein A3B48_02890 [Candidatus Gottesmanbacteria bacterium RIFCSPLOWO2_01_FULL_40_10]OGG25554.1 MAG: hypothetical protein A3E42_04410 [Candidatus Gottesmanbacteria bacterium RIFCSPHIGHO2_12_FULL_40_13]
MESLVIPGKIDPTKKIIRQARRPREIDIWDEIGKAYGQENEPTPLPGGIIFRRRVLGKNPREQS